MNHETVDELHKSKIIEIQEEIDFLTEYVFLNEPR